MTKTPIWEGNRWRLRVQINGKTHSFVSRKAGKAGKIEVNRRYRAFLNGHSATRSKVNEIYAQFLEHYEDEHGKTPTLRNHYNFGRLYILPKIGDLRVENLNLSILQEIISKARPQGRTAATGQLSYKYLSNLRESISAFVKYCVVNDYMEPLKSTLYIPKKAPEGVKDSLQPDEIQRLFEPIDNFYVNVFRFIVLTGMRPGEAYGLQKKDYNPFTKTVVIRRSVDNNMNITNGKNKNALRHFVLSDLAVSVLKKQLSNTEHLHSKWIFCALDGDIINPKTVYKQYRKIGAAKDIHGSPYTLRHTFVSIMKHDLDIDALKRVVGHSSNFDTLGVYGHELTGEMQKSAAVIDKTFNNIMQGII